MGALDDWFQAQGPGVDGITTAFQNVNPGWTDGASLGGSDRGVTGFVFGPSLGPLKPEFTDHVGVLGTANNFTGVTGTSNNQPGVYGQFQEVAGLPSGLRAGVLGASGGSAPGVMGWSNGSPGVYGQFQAVPDLPSDLRAGVIGASTAFAPGVMGWPKIDDGVHGESDGTGVSGISNKGWGVQGISSGI